MIAGLNIQCSLCGECFKSDIVTTICIDCKRFHDIELKKKLLNRQRKINKFRPTALIFPYK